VGGSGRGWLAVPAGSTKPLLQQCKHTIQAAAEPEAAAPWQMDAGTQSQQQRVVGRSVGDVGGGLRAMHELVCLMCDSCMGFRTVKRIAAAATYAHVHHS
jgi:hypothetical protein